jgi:hypothetical protein
VAEVALPPKEPAIVAVVFEQIVRSEPALTVAEGLIVMVLVALTTEHILGAFVVSVRVTVPLKLAAGVYVTDAGVAVCAVLLNNPPPEVMDHAPVVAPPPTDEPANVMAEGVVD